MAPTRPRATLPASRPLGREPSSGPTTIKVGRFNAWGSLIAVYLLQSGITGLQIVGLSGWVDQVFNGTALVLAVMFATIVARKTVAGSST